MSHLKRQAVPKNWPIRRKGTAFVVTPSFGKGQGIPVLVVLRDLLKAAKNRREVKKAIQEKSILVNGKEVKDEKNSMLLFDTITLVPSKEIYRLDLAQNGKFKLEETKDADKKTAKVVDKKVLKGKKVQLNLSDGRNFLSDLKCSMNDSVIVDLKNKKLEKCLPLAEKAKAIVFQGKHAGKRGVIEKVDKERKMVKIVSGERSSKVLIKQVMIIE